MTKISELNKTGFFWMFTERIVRLSFAFITSILIARKLGPSQFGEYSFNQSILSILSVLILLGFDGILVRHLITNHEKKFNVLKTALILRCISIVIISIGLIFYFIIQDSNWLFLVMSISLIFQGLNVYEFYFQSQKKIKIVALINLIAVFFTTALKIYGIVTNNNVIFFGIIYTVEFLFIFLLNLAVFKYLKTKSIENKTKAKFTTNNALALLKDSWPMVFSGFIVILYMRVDQIAVNYYFQSEKTAIYITATKLVEIWLFFPTMLVSIFFPYLTHYYVKKEKLKFEKNIQILYITVILFGVIIGCICFFFNRFIIENTFGEEYSQSADVLKIYGWIVLFAGIGVIRTAQ